MERGATLVDQAGDRVALTVQRVAGVMELMGEIKNAGQEQARGIAQMGEAVRQLDAATQQNALLVDDSSCASIGMKNQVRRLLEVVHQFQLVPQAAVGAVQTPRQAGPHWPALHSGPVSPQQLSMSSP